jgi:AcrR family transcriptional regulator
MDAAERLLDERGRAVPLYEVGRAARVGQATLYRHFPDRTALLAAVLEERLEELEGIAAEQEGRPDAVLTLLRAMAAQQAGSAALLELLRESGPASPEVRGLIERIHGLVAEPIATAIAAGLVRPDFGTDDFTLVLGMLDGTLHGAEEPHRAAVADRTLTLVLGGVLSR